MIIWPISIILPTNSAPYVYDLFDTVSYFVSATVTTSENYNEQTGSCIGQTKMMTIQNTKGNGQAFTLGCAYAAIVPPIYASPVSQTGLKCNSYRLGFAPVGCVLMYPTIMTSGYSNTITFGPVSTWTCYGGANSDSMVWTYTDAGSVPAINDILSSGSVSTAGSYPMSALGSVSGDSVIFRIIGPNAQISHILGPNTASYTFSAAEMASLGTTGGNKSGLLQICPYRMHLQIINGAKCYFIKETCMSKYVILWFNPLLIGIGFYKLV